MLEYRATVLHHHVAARELGQAVADLVVNHLVLLRGWPLKLRRRQFDHLDRHFGTKAQARIGDIVLAALLGALAATIGDLFGLWLGRYGGVAQ